MQEVEDFAHQSSGEFLLAIRVGEAVRLVVVRCMSAGSRQGRSTRQLEPIAGFDRIAIIDFILRKSTGDGLPRRNFGVYIVLEISAKACGSRRDCRRNTLPISSLPDLKVVSKSAGESREHDVASCNIKTEQLRRALRRQSFPFQRGSRAIDLV